MAPHRPSTRRKQLRALWQHGLTRLRGWKLRALEKSKLILPLARRWRVSPGWTAPLALSGVLLLGGTMGWLLARGSGAEAVLSAPASAPGGGLHAETLAEMQREIASLRNTLEHEIAYRGELQWNVAWLMELLGDPALARALSRDDDPGPEEAVGSASHAVNPPFDSAALVAQGVRPDQVDRIRELWETVEREKLALDHEATAEGWKGTFRHFKALRELENGLRDELEDSEYDLYLYAARRPNRVVVHDVVDIEAADRGFRSGDIVLRYDGVRVFSPDELLRLSSAGSPGEPVSVEIQRGTRTLTLGARRGPLGVLLVMTRMDPLGPRI